MAYNTRELDNAIVLEPVGKITIGHGDVLLREAVNGAVDAGHRRIIVDMDNVRTLDSAGTGELVAAHRLLEELGGRLVLTRLSPRVGGMLVATRLSGVLEIHESIEGAILDLAA